MMRLFSGVLFIAVAMVASAQRSSMGQADSLFGDQQYTQAYELYDSIYDQGLASSAMLLKMAFIQDGLGNYDQALLFLDKYYQKSADRNVVLKLEQLSEENGLSGYQYNDLHFFTALLLKYKLYLVVLLLSVSLLLVLYVLRKWKKSERHLAAGILQLICLVLAIGINSFSAPNRAIVVSDHSLLRSGPSAGAEPIDQISRGHKVKVVAEGQVWVKIIWEGEEVYVKKSNIQVI